jgi:hypothetical protein
MIPQTSLLLVGGSKKSKKIVLVYPLNRDAATRMTREDPKPVSLKDE